MEWNRGAEKEKLISDEEAGRSDLAKPTPFIALPISRLGEGIEEAQTLQSSHGNQAATPRSDVFSLPFIPGLSKNAYKLKRRRFRLAQIKALLKASNQNDLNTPGSSMQCNNRDFSPEVSSTNKTWSEGDGIELQKKTSSADLKLVGTLGDDSRPIKPNVVDIGGAVSEIERRVVVEGEKVIPGLSKNAYKHKKRRFKDAQLMALWKASNQDHLNTPGSSMQCNNRDFSPEVSSTNKTRSEGDGIELQNNTSSVDLKLVGTLGDDSSPIKPNVVDIGGTVCEIERRVVVEGEKVGRLDLNTPAPCVALPVAQAQPRQSSQGNETATPQGKVFSLPFIPGLSKNSYKRIKRRFKLAQERDLLKASSGNHLNTPGPLEKSNKRDSSPGVTSAKRSKIEGVGIELQKNITSGDLKVVAKLVDGRPIKPNEINIIERYLVVKGCKSQKEKLQTDPHLADQQFRIIRTGLMQDRSMYLITCANSYTVQVIISDMAEEWAGSGIQVVKYLDLPQPCLISTYIPRVVFEKDDMLDVLKAQNRGFGLQFDKWKIRIWDRKPTGGVFLKIEVPEADAAIVKTVKNLGVGSRVREFRVTWERAGVEADNKESETSRDEYPNYPSSSGLTADRGSCASRGHSSLGTGGSPLPGLRLTSEMATNSFTPPFKMGNSNNTNFMSFKERKVENNISESLMEFPSMVKDNASSNVGHKLPSSDSDSESDSGNDWQRYHY